MPQSSNDHSIQLKCLRRLLRPFLRFCLRHGHTIQFVQQALKGAFIEVAEEELRKKDEKASITRLSVMTGIDRKELTRLSREPEAYTDEEPGGMLTKVLGQWEQDSRFTTKAGKPRILRFQGEQSEFEQLVASVTKHVGPKAVILELERRGLIERTSRGLKLLRTRYRYKEDPEETFNFLAENINYLIVAVEENISDANKIRNPQLLTEYDNVYYSDVPEIRRWLLEENRVFHKRAREYLSQFDHDLNPDLSKEGDSRAKVALGGFGWCSKPEEEV